MALQVEKKKGSKFIIFLITLYMTSILIFSTNADLNIYSQLLFIVAFGCCAAALLFKGVKLNVDRYIIFFVAFILVCRFSEAWAISPSVAMGEVTTLVQLLIMSVILLTYIVHTGEADSFVRALLYSGVFVAIYVVGYYGIDEYIELLKQGERAGTDINNVNTIGMYMAFTVFIGFYYGYVRKKKLGYATMILPLILTLGSASRKALFAAVVGIALIAVLEYRRKITIKTFFKAILMFVVIAIILQWLSTLSIFAGAFERFRTMLGLGGHSIDSSAATRQKMIAVGWRYFLEHPFTGCGIGNSTYIMYDELKRFVYTHNNFIELLASVGIFGFLFFYAIYGYLLTNLYRIFRRRGSQVAMILFVMLTIRLILEYGMVSYYSKINYIYFTIGAAEILIDKKKRREEAEKNVLEPDKKNIM